MKCDLRMRGSVLQNGNATNERNANVDHSVNAEQRERSSQKSIQQRVGLLYIRPSDINWILTFISHPFFWNILVSFAIFSWSFIGEPWDYGSTTFSVSLQFFQETFLLVKYHISERHSLF